MPKELVLRISETGETVVGLYDDNFNWRALGPLQVLRASRVEFNPKTQKWEVHLINEDRVLPKAFWDRGDAIAHEVEYLNDHLDTCPFLKTEKVLKRCRSLMSKL